MTLSRRLLAAAFVVAALAAVPGIARAQAFISGAQLARACGSHAPTDENACNGYIAGALDEVAANAELKAAICPPAGTKLSVLRDALGKFGQQRPDDAKGSGIALLHAMIKATYPCPAK